MSSNLCVCTPIVNIMVLLPAFEPVSFLRDHTCFEETTGWQQFFLVIEERDPVQNLTLGGLHRTIVAFQAEGRDVYEMLNMINCLIDVSSLLVETQFQRVILIFFGEAMPGDVGYCTTELLMDVLSVVAGGFLPKKKYSAVYPSISRMSRTLENLLTIWTPNVENWSGACALAVELWLFDNN
eukprot:Gb_30180 [translate_table: standard]